jgi:type VI secretion system secreted protein Hcp
MKYGDLQGDVTAAGHEKWIELNSFQWGVGRGISSPTGAAADRESSAPSVSEITVKKAQDRASTKLLNHAYQGEGVDVTIDFCKTDKGNLEVFLELNLTNTMVSGFSVSGTDRHEETLSLNFTKVEYKLLTHNADGTPGDPDSIVYDIGQAKVV